MVDEYYGRPFAVHTFVHKWITDMSVNNVPVHYLCTGTFVHKSSSEYLCTER